MANLAVRQLESLELYGVIAGFSVVTGAKGRRYEVRTHRGYRTMTAAQVHSYAQGVADALHAVVEGHSVIDGVNVTAGYPHLSEGAAK